MVGGMNAWEWESVKCVDLKDAILALQVVLHLHPDKVDITNDINGDEKIGFAEAIYILQHVAGLRCD